MPAVFTGKKIMAVSCVFSVLLLASCSEDGPIEGNNSNSTAVVLDAKQLETELQEFAESMPEAKVFGDKALRSSIPAAQDWMENIEVNPSKCGVTFAAPIAEQLKNATMGAIEYPGGYLTVALFKDEEVLKEQWQAKSEESSGCSRYTVKSGDESRAYHLAKQPVDTQAALNESYVVTSSDGSTTEQQLIVRSANSNVLIGLQEKRKSGTAAEQVSSATVAVQTLLGQLNR